METEDPEITCLNPIFLNIFVAQDSYVYNFITGDLMEKILWVTNFQLRKGFIPSFSSLRKYQKRMNQKKKRKEKNESRCRRERMVKEEKN